MLVVVLVVFTLLWGPLVIFRILREYTDAVTQSYYMDGRLNYAFDSMSFLSSSVNPILLPLSSKSVHYSSHSAPSQYITPPTQLYVST